MARSPKEAGKMVSTPNYDKASGNSISPAGSNKPQPGSGLEQIDGAGTQSGSHPAKSQSKTMRYI